MENLPPVADLLGDIEMLTIDAQEDVEKKFQRERLVSGMLLARLGINDPETTRERVSADIRASQGLTMAARGMILRSLV